jgi:transposase
MPYSLEQRTLILRLSVRTGFVKFTREKFVEQCPVASVPKKRTVQQLVRKWRSTGSVSNARKHRNPSVRTPKAVDVISDRMDRSPH